MLVQWRFINHNVPNRASIFPVDATKHLKHFYIAGIRDKSQRILASLIFLTSAESSKEPDMLDTIQKLFGTYQQTKPLMKHAVSCAISKLKINSKNGTLEDTITSEKDLEVICHEFYMNNSISGKA